MLARGILTSPLSVFGAVLPVAACGLTALGCGSSSGSHYGPPPSTGQTTAPIRSANSGSVATTTSSTTNAAPTLDVSPQASALPLNQAHLLTATASDDGLPAGTLTYAWSQVSGPEAAWFSQPTLPELRVGLPVAGTYVIRCEVSDGERTTAVEVQLEGQEIQEVPAFPEVGFLSRTLVGEEAGKAYYDTLDPEGERDTLAGFLRVNGFDQGGPDVESVYFNAGDLGFGRAMSAKVIDANTMAFVTTNHANLDDVINDADEIATVVMEISPGPNGGPSFTKFFVYDGNGERVTGADLDGHGTKYVPDLCISCHGGTAQPIVNGVYGNGGDIGARLLPFDAQTFEFTNRNGFTRADQEAPLKALNEAVYRSPVVSDTVKELIEGWYGGPGFPRATQQDDFVPAEWVKETELYLEVYAPSCRTCHANMDAPLDFASSDVFLAHSPKIQAELEKRTMPDSRRTFEAFWSSSRPALLAASLTNPTPVTVPLGLPQVAVEVEREIETDSANFLLDVRVDFAGVAEVAVANPQDMIDAAEARIVELGQQRQILINEGRGQLVQEVDQRIADLDRRRDRMVAWLDDNTLAQLQAQQAALMDDWDDLLDRANRRLANANGRAQGQVRDDTRFQINSLVNDLRGGVRRLQQLQRELHSASAPVRPAGE